MDLTTLLATASEQSHWLIPNDDSHWFVNLVRVFGIVVLCFISIIVFTYAFVIAWMEDGRTTSIWSGSFIDVWYNYSKQVRRDWQKKNRS